jgi:hypothetical protein
MLNENIPYFKCLIKESYFTKNPKDSNKYHNAYAFGVQSIMGKILTFHIMTDYGMLRSRVPLSEIYLQETIKDITFYYKQLWDFFYNDAKIITYSYLKEKKCKVILRDKTHIWATYLFTIDWQHNPYSDEPTDYKCGHVLAADDGYLMCMPNNRIFWKDSNWVTKQLPEDLKQFKVDTELPSVENQSDRWITEDGDSFYYDMNETIH